MCSFGVAIAYAMVFFSKEQQLDQQNTECMFLFLILCEEMNLASGFKYCTNIYMLSDETIVNFKIPAKKRESYFLLQFACNSTKTSESK